PRFPRGASPADRGAHHRAGPRRLRRGRAVELHYRRAGAHPRPGCAAPGRGAWGWPLCHRRKAERALIVPPISSSGVLLSLVAEFWTRRAPASVARETCDSVGIHVAEWSPVASPGMRTYILALLLTGCGQVRFVDAYPPQLFHSAIQYATT